MKKLDLLERVKNRIEFCEKMKKGYRSVNNLELLAIWSMRQDELQNLEELLESPVIPLQGLDERLEYCRKQEAVARDMKRFSFADGWVVRQNEIQNVIEMVKGTVKKKRLFIDMDGTLTVFTPQKGIEPLYEKGYFLRLMPHENVIDAVKHIIRNYPDIEVNVLSAVLMDSRYALQEKQLWLNKYLPEVDAAHQIFVPNGSDKKEWIWEFSEHDTLMDDFTKNLLKWLPGKGIKLLNGINHTKGTWQYDKVRYDQEPVDLAENIVSIVKGKK